MSKSAATSTDMVEQSATTNESKIPDEVVSKLKTFNDALSALEDAIKPHLESNFEDHLKRETLEMARIDLMSLYTVNSLCWSLLALRGQDPKADDSLRTELDRTKEYCCKLKKEEERRLRLGVNDKVAKAVVRNALFDPQEYQAKKNRKRRLDQEGEDGI